VRTDSPTENVEVFFLTENVSRTVIVIQCVISGSEFSFLHIFVVIAQVKIRETYIFSKVFLLQHKIRDTYIFIAT